MEPDIKLTAREILQSLKIIHFASIFSSVIFLIISLLIVSIYGPLAKLERANSQILLTVGIIAGAILVSLAYYIHSQRLKQNIQTPFIIRLKSYKNSMLVKIALMEAASMFVLVIYLMTSIASMLAGSAIIITLLFLNRPGINFVSNELNLSENDISDLQE
jgi:hypothetical protein